MSKPLIRTLAARPDVQYLLAFVAGLVVFFLVGLISNIIPYYRIITVPYPTHAPDLLWYNIWTNALTNFVGAAIAGFAFWLLGPGFKVLGVKKIKPRALWLGAATAGALLFLAATAEVIYSLTGYPDLSPDSQVLFDGAALCVLGFCFVGGWWVTRWQSGLKS